MFARYGAAIAIGAGVTFGLLFLMQFMIDMGRGAITERKSAQNVDFVRVERTESVQTEREKPEKPPEAQEQPDMPNNSNSDSFNNSMAVSMSAPSMSGGVDVGGVGMGVSDGEYLPIVKVQPVYPSRALQRGLEGYVIVEYTVTKTGSTKNPQVVESTSSIFEDAAIESALKYKYKPRVINGEAVEVPGVQTKITFELED